MESTTSQRSRCEFCGQELKPLYTEALFGGKPVFMGFEQCQCEGAVKARKEAEVAEEEARREAEARAFYDRLEKSGVPKRYLKAHHQLAEGLAEKVESGGSLYVWGANGTLKTTLASAIMRRLVYHGKRCEMVNSVDLFIRIQSTYGTPEREEDVLKRYSTKPFLVIDDMGKEQQTSWTASRLYSIVNARYGSMLPTVITSNFRISELATRMSQVDGSTAQAIASRLMGMCEVIESTGTDRRVS